MDYHDTERMLRALGMLADSHKRVADAFTQIAEKIGIVADSAERAADAMEKLAAKQDSETKPEFHGHAPKPRMRATAAGMVPAERPKATEAKIERHAVKRNITYPEAWRYFEREGYDMSQAEQYPR